MGRIKIGEKEYKKMAKLYYATENGKVLIKEAMLSKETVEGFYELYGENEIENIVLEKVGEHSWLGKFFVD